MANLINPFFEVTIHDIVYKFGDMNANQPRLMEGRFEYTCLDSNGVTTDITLSLNTVGAALDAIVITSGLANETEMSWWWNVPPSVQWNTEDEGRTLEQIMALEIGEERDLRLTITPIAPITQ